jgi:hypothetical protein
MNHDATFAINRLRGLATQLERGEHDAALGDGDDAEAAHWAAAIAARCRQMADAIESAAP